VSLAIWQPYLWPKAGKERRMRNEEWRIHILHELATVFCLLLAWQPDKPHCVRWAAHAAFVAVMTMPHIAVWAMFMTLRGTGVQFQHQHQHHTDAVKERRKGQLRLSLKRTVESLLGGWACGLCTYVGVCVCVLKSERMECRCRLLYLCCF